MTSRRPSRTLYAAGLVVLLLVGPLVAWLYTGWADVRSRQHEIRTAVQTDAAARASELARELRGQLDRLFAHEQQRKYYDYQNLQHDEKGSIGWSVSPSPLASTPEDPLVLGYFQIDGRGRVTTPTINDEIPELSDTKHLAENRAFRDEVTRSFSPALSPARVLLAQAGARVEVDSSTYAQNATANKVYAQQLDNNGNYVNPAQPGKWPVAVTISPLEWRTLTYAGQPVLVAARLVTTPDGRLVQGFVVDRATVTGWLASHAGDKVAELKQADGSETQIAPGWMLSVAPNPRAITAAAGDADHVARVFVVRYTVVSTLAAFAALLVVLLVAKAERVARERSQFAAAAAHELRTPLAGLQLYGDMLADGLGDPGKLRDYAKRMSEEASRLGRVVSNVLGFSQLERGSLAVDAKVGDLGEAIRDLVEHAEPALVRAGATLEIDVDPELRARFDRDALARVLGNLLDNAEKYSRGAADRTIRLAAVDRGDAIELAVCDRGPGVSENAKLFQPFARGVAHDGPAGLGLGLALSLSLARAMGGDLSYRAGEGATFVLRLLRA